MYERYAAKLMSAAQLPSAGIAVNVYVCSQVCSHDSTTVLDSHEQVSTSCRKQDTVYEYACDLGY